MNGCPPLQHRRVFGDPGLTSSAHAKTLPREEPGLCTAFLIWEIFVVMVLEFGMYDLAGFAISVVAVDKQGNPEIRVTPEIVVTNTMF